MQDMKLMEWGGQLVAYLLAENEEKFQSDG